MTIEAHRGSGEFSSREDGLAAFIILWIVWLGIGWIISWAWPPFLFVALAALLVQWTWMAMRASVHQRGPLGVWAYFLFDAPCRVCDEHRRARR